MPAGTSIVMYTVAVVEGNKTVVDESQQVDEPGVHGVDGEED